MHSPGLNDRLTKILDNHFSKVHKDVPVSMAYFGLTQADGLKEDIVGILKENNNILEELFSSKNDQASPLKKDNQEKVSFSIFNFLFRLFSQIVNFLFRPKETKNSEDYDDKFLLSNIEFLKQFLSGQVDYTDKTIARAEPALELLIKKIVSRYLEARKVNTLNNLAVDPTTEDKDSAAVSTDNKAPEEKSLLGWGMFKYKLTPRAQTTRTVEPVANFTPGIRQNG